MPCQGHRELCPCQNFPASKTYCFPKPPLKGQKWCRVTGEMSKKRTTNVRPPINPQWHKTHIKELPLKVWSLPQRWNQSQNLVYWRHSSMLTNHSLSIIAIWIMHQTQLVQVHHTECLISVYKHKSQTMTEQNQSCIDNILLSWQQMWVNLWTTGKHSPICLHRWKE